jgi:hypothetical protein
MSFIGILTSAAEIGAGVATGNPALITAGAGSGAGNLFAGLSGNKKDAGRIAQAASSLQQALDGDATQLAFIVGQASNSATSVGKEAYRRALAEYNRQAGTNYQPGAVANVPKSISPLQRIISNTISNIRTDAGAGVQQALATSANTAGSAIAGGNGTGLTSGSISRTQVYLAGAVALAAILALKKRAR